jgi:8-oxo-dGTP pyrophosphatase MutT (NUDIX family)
MVCSFPWEIWRAQIDMIKCKYLTPLTDRGWLAEQLRQSDKTLMDSPRGDHDLNPGTRSVSPLTPAAVLIPLIVHMDKTTVLLTQRTEHLAKHPGQISFPGGHMEDVDGTPEETALRETEEETGLHRRHIDVIGRLDDYETRTGFRVTPVVAMVTPPFDIKPDPHEVAEAFEVPLAFLLDPVNHQRHSHIYEGTKREFYAIPFNEYFIWGATAGMLINLYEVLESS